MAEPRPASPVTLVEFGDYESPACRRALPVVKAVLALMGEDLHFQFRHFPLSNLHPHAMTAAEAAEAARAQGRFWPMHELLFANQNALLLENLASYAGALGLDLRWFLADLGNRVHLARVRADFREGVRLGVNATPAFFIDGERYGGRVAPEALVAALREVPRATG